MVPFADAFNHKSALVKLTGHYAVEPVCFEDNDDTSDDSGSNATDQDSDASAEVASADVQAVDNRADASASQASGNPSHLRLRCNRDEVFVEKLTLSCQPA